MYSVLIIKHCSLQGFETLETKLKDRSVLSISKFVEKNHGLQFDPRTICRYCCMIIAANNWKVDYPVPSDG